MGSRLGSVAPDDDESFDAALIQMADGGSLS
jgi:hypothetical protein